MQSLAHANTIAGGYDFGRLYWSQSPTYLRACGHKESKWFNPGPNREQRCSQERASAQLIAKIRAHFGLDRGLGRRPPPTAIVPLDPAVQRTFKKITRLLGFADIHPPDADKGWQFDELYMQAWQEEYERKMDVPEIARKVQLRIDMHAATVINASVLCYLTRRAYLRLRGGAAEGFSIVKEALRRVEPSADSESGCERGGESGGESGGMSGGESGSESGGESGGETSESD